MANIYFQLTRRLTEFNPLLRNVRSKAPVQTCRGLAAWARSLVLEANQTPTAACLHGRVVKRKIYSERIMWNLTRNHPHSIQRLRTPRLMRGRVFGDATKWALWEWHSTICMLGENQALHITTNTPSPSWSMVGQQQQEDLLPVKTRMPNEQQRHREGSQSAEWVATSTQAPSPIETWNLLFTPDPQGTSETLTYFESGGKKIATSLCARMPAEDQDQHSAFKKILKLDLVSLFSLHTAI